MIDQWRRNATLNLNNGENFLTTDWERVDGGGQGDMYSWNAECLKVGEYLLFQ